MFGLAIALLIINIILMISLYLKLSKKFSKTNLIREMKNDAQNLLTTIAFQTDRSVTVIEEKIKEVNAVKAELEKTIFLAEEEIKRKKHQAEVINELSNNTSTQTQAINISTIKQNEEQAPKNPAVQIYTKQRLAKPQIQNAKIKQSFQDQIIEMAKNGLSIEMISEKIPLPMGEIELIISMHT